MEKRYLSGNNKPSFDVSSSDRLLNLSRQRTINVTKPPPPRTAFAAVAMLIVGTALLIAGLVVFFDKSQMSSRARNGALPMICLGSVCKYKSIQNQSF